MRKKILQTLYKIFPFDLTGDCVVPPARDGIKISCIINFYGRLDVLSGILFSLAMQKFPREEFEVILVEDRGGTDDGKMLAAKFEALLPIIYKPLDKNYGYIGYSRNYGLSFSRGEYVFFLDDDTVILQRNFLSQLIQEFDISNADGIIPFGTSSYYLLKGRYGYHEPFFPTNRCMAYRRETLQELGGFWSGIIGQEDVEFSIRFIVARKKYFNFKKLEYYHPPLVLNNSNKAASVGYSFAKLRARYSLPIYLLLLLNGLRYLPLIIFPFSMKRKMQARFSLGFLKGIFWSLKNDPIYYQQSL